MIKRLFCFFLDHDWSYRGTDQKAGKLRLAYWKCKRCGRLDSIPPDHINNPR